MRGQNVTVETSTVIHSRVMYCHILLASVIIVKPAEWMCAEYFWETSSQRSVYMVY